MYLKSIEIHGFKSFANKIRFEFPDGITGIVGPNGSGKSNVADAVRWVLGEQKVKQLRSSKMEDVIFAGTAARKPMGYAFVSITLDNSDHKLKVDYDEVTVSRRVYRSGESEYMLNGSVCRLRDVQEMFYDTGIGKEGYSIIGQGQIDKILQGKPEERRELFDEAAGIVKYKKRKIIALRKLENERLNLTRINDILSELGKQVGPLKRQSEAALKFIDLKNELKDLDINLFLIENGEIKAKISEYERKEQIAAQELEQEKENLESMKEGYENLNAEIIALDELIETIRNRIAQGNIIKETLNGQINVLNEQINSAKEARLHYQERITALTANVRRSTEEKERLEHEKQVNQEALTKAVADADMQASIVLDIQGSEEELNSRSEELKEKLMDLVNARGEINARIERLNVLSEQMVTRRSELAGSLEQFMSDKEAQEKVVNELKAECEEAEKEEHALMDEISSKESELKQTDLGIVAAQRDINKAREDLAKDKARLESVRNITERYEGYGSSIKEIMKLKENNKGIHGVVADIIRTEKKYEVAIETALGGNIQNVVTDTEATAKTVIEYLKRNKLGRATFLPVKAVTGRGEFKNDEVFSERGVLGIASALVDVDPQYKGVANYLLGRIVVCDTIDNALLLARKYNYSLIIVTLEGELLNRGGSLTGGAFKNKSNLLGRRREIDELEAAIKDNTKKQDDLKKHSEQLEKRKEEITDRLLDLRTDLQEKRILLNTAKINLEQADRKKQEIESGFEKTSAERENIEQQEILMSEENDALNDSLGENAKEEEAVKKQITDLSAEMEILKEKEAEALLLRQSLNAKLSGLDGQNQILAGSIAKIVSDIAILNEEMEKIHANAAGSEGDAEAKQKEIADINDALARADAEEKALTAQLEAHAKQKEEFSASNREYIEKREYAQGRIADLDKEVFRLAQLKEKMEDRFESRSSYIWDEYELTYNAALPLRKEELTDTKEMRERIAQLKSSIRGLGVINVSAIEEYKEVKERHEFLSGQQLDLQKAEADLVKIIRDLDKEMRRQFNSEFKKIQEEFSRVFKVMFGGGQGTIELEENEDVLDAGITIVAQPPGKKLQNMMQLSGGEKALTAIAVLFAIQNLKPSPFCILDEIEAALDDSNIIRFASYLHKLESDVQFIVITHRKGTMEAANRLYGITMQEKGVSTLISVNLEDFDEDELEVG